MTATLERPSEQSGEPTGFTHLSAFNGRPSPRALVGLVVLTICLAAFGAQAGFFLESLRADVWQARTEVEYRGNSWTETQSTIVDSNTLLAPIAERYGIPIKQFNEDLEAGVVPGSQTVRFDYFDNDADLALNVVTDLQADYLAAVTERASEEAMVTLQSELVTFNEALTVAQDELSNLRNDGGIGLSVEQQDKQSEIATIRTRILELERMILDAELDELNNTRIPRVTAEPFVFDEPFTPRPRRMAVVGFILGAAIGLGYLIWRWWLTAVSEAY